MLADVPCSGTGTLARNPEIKWRLKPEDLNDLHAKQVAILRAALQQLAPGAARSIPPVRWSRKKTSRGGRSAAERLSNSLCWIAARNSSACASEGELATSDLDSLLDGPYLRTIPGVQPCDGFFAALLERQELIA